MLLSAQRILTCQHKLRRYRNTGIDKLKGKKKDKTKNGVFPGPVVSFSYLMNPSLTYNTLKRMLKRVPFWSFFYVG